jgi:hypothetical protein
VIRDHGFRWPLVVGVLIVAVFVLAIGFQDRLSGASPRLQNADNATPCPNASPAPGSPIAESATAIASPESCATESVMGIPLAIDGLVINLTSDKDQAGPITLNIDVHDQDGAPVTGATVTLTASSLEMDMGANPHEAVEKEPGRYVAEQVPMGMGGSWRVEIDVHSPDGTSVVAYFKVELEGPM